MHQAGDAASDVRGVWRTACDFARGDGEQEHDEKVPWLGADGKTLRWRGLRLEVAIAVTHPAFDVASCLITLAHVAAMAVEVEEAALCHPVWSGRLDECPHWRADGHFWWLNRGFLVLYSVEALMGVFVWRSSFPRRAPCLCGLAVVVSGWALLASGTPFSIAWLRLFLLFRPLSAAAWHLFRASEVCSLFGGVWSAFRTALACGALLAAVLVAWAFVAVEFVHPVGAGIGREDCDDCATGFRSVPDAVLTLFEVTVAGRAWGELSRPLLRRSPALAVIMVGAVLTVLVGVLSLSAAVLVEAVQRGSGRRKHADQFFSREDLLRCCAVLDTDGGGHLSVDTIRAAWNSGGQFRSALGRLGVTSRELDVALEVLGANIDGGVEYAKLVAFLYQPPARGADEARVGGDLVELRRDVRVQIDAAVASLDKRLADLDACLAAEPGSSASYEAVFAMPSNLGGTQPAATHFDTPELPLALLASPWAGKDDPEMWLADTMRSLSDLESEMARVASQQLAAVLQRIQPAALQCPTGAKGSRATPASEWLQHHTRTRLALLMQDVQRCHEVQEGLVGCIDHLLSPPPGALAAAAPSRAAAANEPERACAPMMPAPTGWQGGADTLMDPPSDTDPANWAFDTDPAVDPSAAAGREIGGVGGGAEGNAVLAWHSLRAVAPVASLHAAAGGRPPPRQPAPDDDGAPWPPPEDEDDQEPGLPPKEVGGEGANNDLWEEYDASTWEEEGEWDGEGADDGYGYTYGNAYGDA